MYEIWLAPLRLVGARRRRSSSSRRRASCARWVAERFARVLQASATAVLGPDGRRRRARGRRGRARRRRRRAARPTPPPRTTSPRPTTPASTRSYTFEQFVIGDANRFAHAAALAVAELPGQAYNPLFLYGPPGVGKTHLLHSIGNYVRAYGGGLTRPLHDGRDVHERVHRRPARTATIDRFKGRFRRQPTSCSSTTSSSSPRKAKTEEEFFHTFNALLRDRQPARPHLRPPPARPRARSRSACASASRPASSPTSRRPTSPRRLTILRKRVQHDGIELADDGGPAR